MPMELHCPECQALLRIADENAERQTRCPSCSAVFTAAEKSTPLSAPIPSPHPPTGVDPTNPYAPSSTGPDVRPTGSTEWAPRVFSVDEVFSSTWAIFKDQWLKACVAVLIVMGVNMGASTAQNILIRVLPQIINDQVLFLVSQFAVFFTFWLLQMWIQIGQILIMFDIARGREIRFGRVFAGGPYLANIVLAVIMIVLVVAAAGLVLVGLPTAVVGLATQDPGAAAATAIVAAIIASPLLVILSLMVSQCQMLIIDRGMGPVESLYTSYEITKGNKFTIFLIGMLAFLILLGAIILGLLALCVGVIPAIIGFSGFSSLLMVVTYLTMTGQRITVPGDHFSAGPAT
jgi:predicted Zn finger-like uncharacterized protein